MAPPGKKYFKGRIYVGDAVHHYVIWDGVRDFQNAPSEAVIAAEFPRPPRAIYTAQVSTEMLMEHSATFMLDVLLLAPEPNSHFILWARDHRTYRTIVEEMTRDGFRLQ